MAPGHSAVTEPHTRGPGPGLQWPFLPFFMGMQRGERVEGVKRREQWGGVQGLQSSIK